jgi:glucosamine-6-phosphate deaminase
MKLSFSTLACPSWPLGRVLETAGRLGYDGVELRFLEDDDALWARPELTGSGLAETRARLGDAGLEVPCVDTRSFFHWPDPARRARALEEAERVVALAHDLGAPGVRVFGDAVQPGADLESTRRWIAESLLALAEKARPAGVEVWIESHGDFAPARAMLSVLDLVKADGVGVLWDAPNAFEAGDEPGEGARLLGHRIRHVHLKDVRVRPGGHGKAVLPGQGEFPLVPALTALRGLGYPGWLSFEWEKKWQPEIEEAEVALPRFLDWVSPALRVVPSAPRDAGARSFVRARLEVVVHPDRPALGQSAARLVAAHIRSEVAAHGRAAVIFASAPSQNEFLAALRADPDVPWTRLTALHLDEYVGVAPDHPASFRRFLSDRLFGHVPVGAFHGLDGRAPDLAGECARYADLLRREAPSLELLGIGENGHLAFIDPPMCDFHDPSEVRVVELDEACRRQQVHDGGFALLEEVPRRALSLTIPRLLAVPRAVAIVPGPAKRTAVAAALDGPVTTACPASILRRHPHATLFLDEESAGGLERCAKPS